MSIHCEKKVDRRPFNGELGFSFVEVVIVLVILGVLLAVALPQGVRQLQLHRLDSCVSIVSNKVMEARMDAIKRNRTSTLHLDLEDRNVQIRSTDNAAAVIDVGFPEGFTGNVVLDEASDVDIAFDSLGRLAAAQTVTLLEANTGLRKDITVSLAGRVSVGPMY